MDLVTPIYAGLIALLFLVLSFRVVLGRRAHKVSYGDGGNKDLLKRMRAQANCAEYAPVGVILLLMAELQRMPPWLVHAAGATLLAGRLLHAYGFGHTPQIVILRIWGMYLTVGMIALTAIATIAHALF